MSAHYAVLAGDDDDTKQSVSSPDTLTPTSTSPDHTHYSQLADHTSTPLSVVGDSIPATAPSHDTTKVAVDALLVGGGGTTAGATATYMHSGSHLGPPTVAMGPSKVPESQRPSRPESNELCSPDSSSQPNHNLNDRGQRPSDALPQPSTQGSPSHDNDNSSIDIPTATNANTGANPLPLRTGSVRADTRLAHPKPINLTTSSSPGSITEPPSDLSTRLGALVGNVAQLEATAEQLSMTSSIDDAIRDLHGELKRSDSRHSSIRAANARSASGDNGNILPQVGPQRGVSSTASIVSTNTAARQGGYSPSGFVMSPTNSLTGRLRSGSKNSNGAPDLESESVLLRHGPGKASVRSARSTKMSLAEISESEPLALDGAALDRADVAPPIEDDPDMTIRFPDDDEKPSTDAFHQMLGDKEMDFGGPIDLGFGSAPTEKRPGSSQSDHTFQQAQDAFVDFDGVHWEPDAELDAMIEELPAPQAPPVRQERPQSYFDPMTGQQMMWYPARVPAMLNLPPKLSSHKPRAAQRDARRSQVLSAMVQSDYKALTEPKHRDSAVPNLKSGSKMPLRDSWLPDPLAGQRESFIGLDSDHFRDPEAHSIHEGGEVVSQDAQSDTPADQLRRPPRLSRMAPEQRHSSMPRADALPPQLRASAFFDLPAAPPQIEVKDGSAMATLDSILDAAAVAPVSAFTDHAIAGKLGSEVYGKAKKRKPAAAPVTSQQLAPPTEPKKRSSFMWLGKQKSGHETGEHATASNEESDEQSEDERSHLTKSIDGHSVIRVPATAEHESEEESEEEEGYQGPPTTLLAELQLRKQQQKQRTIPLTRAFPNGMHATLLEMDAVAEAQRKERKGKRVNLAWEDPDAHYDQNGSDDEDVPLAIIAAKQQGAKNMADIERPIGLMERRELEDNEPLSQRRARLQGIGTQSLAQLHQRQQSTLSLAPAPRPGGSRSPSRAGLTPEPGAEPEEPEVEGETLAERKRRLAAKEEAEGRLPPARPVSRAFSDELLGRFGPEPEETEATRAAEAGEETLGQRRKRLQAEREARDREMSYGNLVGRPITKRNSRLSMSDVLNTYPKKDDDVAVPQQQKPALPQTLSSQIVNRQGGFMGGIYNNGGLRPMQSTPAFNAQGVGYGVHSPGTMGGYGVQMTQQPGYNGMMNPMGGYNAIGVFAPAPAMSMYGGGGGGGGGSRMMQPGMPTQMPMPMGAGSMDRVEQWRQGIL